MVLNDDEYIPTQEELSSKLWRLCNLYYITDKSGNQIKFNLNWAQQELFENDWYKTIILKCRQLGITTFYAISFLDECFWYSNTYCGIIAHNRESSEDIFKKKVKFAYDRMPKWCQAFNTAVNDRSGELTFKNGSSYRVSTGFRSGTYNNLLVSEFGKICSKSPDISKEIVLGSFNTVAEDQKIIVESTAEGREGFFYEYCKEAQAVRDSGRKLTKMDFKFHFFPWMDEPTYRLE